MVGSLILVLVVLTTLWTMPVLSAVFRNSDNYVKDTKNMLLNTTIEHNLVNNNNNSVAIIVTKKDFNETRRVSKELKEEARKKKKPDIMTRILPMMIIPFMLQTAIIPMMLTMLKIMLIKSAFIGKMAILLGLLNMFRVSNNQGGVYTHNIHVGKDHHMHERLAAEHYGYDGGDEYGAVSQMIGMTKT